MLQYVILCYTVFYCALLCFTVLYCAILCYTVLYCVILCFLDYLLCLSKLMDNNIKITSFSKENTRSLTHLYTGLSYLNYYQNKIGNEPSSICSKCQEEDETTSHFLTRCPAFALQRKNIFGNFTIKEESLLTEAIFT